MLVTPHADRRNRNMAIVLAAISALAALLRGALSSIPPIPRPLSAHLLAGAATLPATVTFANSAFPPAWEQSYKSTSPTSALSDADKQRFRQMVMVFLDECELLESARKSTIRFGSW